jgi:ABC-type glycerol-3-phosphate transport system substrate-binding protein
MDKKNINLFFAGIIILRRLAMHKLFVSVLILMILVQSIFFMGCSKDSGSKIDSSDKKTEIVFYGLSDEEGYLQKLFDAYVQNNPNVIIKPQYYATGEYEEVVLVALAASTPIDVLTINGLSPMSNYQEKGFLLDMADMMKAANFDPAKTYGDIYTDSNIGGVHGFPYRNAVWFMFYNKDMLNELGIQVKTGESYTWSEFAALAADVQAKLKAAGKDIESDPNAGCYAGLVGMNYQLPNAQRKARLDDPDTRVIRESWTIWNNLQANGSHLSFAEKLEFGTNVGYVYWTPGRIAFFQNATWGIKTYNDYIARGDMNFQYGVMPMPVPDGVPSNTNPASPNFFGIPVTSKNRQTAYDFIQYACTAEGAFVLASEGVLTAFANDEVLAAYNKYAAQPDDVLSKIISSPNNVLTDICFNGYNEVRSAYQEYMASYLVGTVSLDNAIAGFTAKRKEILGK